MESVEGTYNTNSDGSFHKPLAKTTAAQWKASGQAGVLNTYYPEFSELADGVVYVRFYYEGIAMNGSQAFGGFLANTVAAFRDRKLDIRYADSVSRRAWADTVAAAQRHNDPGNFTTFIAYEYTASTADMGNLHRNVVYKGNKFTVEPFTRLKSGNPEDLWSWMDDLRSRGVDTIAIPHNSNGSNGQMFEMENWEGLPISTKYAEFRMRNEPIVEMTQVKGRLLEHNYRLV